MTTYALRFRRGLAVATTFVLSFGVPALAQAAPPADAEPPQDDGWDDEEDQPPSADEENKSPPQEDDWDDDDDDWGEEEDDDWDGQLLIEDVSDDPEAAEAEKVEQEEVEGDKGTITGVVKDTTTGDPLLGANVRALGTQYEVTTDAEGRYALELPPGTYTLEFFYETFSVKEVANLEIQKDKSRTQDVELTPMAGMTTETVIEAEAPKGNEAATTSARAESTKTEDRMSSEEMQKSGGGSTANVARRIVGSTIVGGRFLFVRGLGHRYGNTLFDGARVPSPEPDLRTVPLDIFPSGALSGINIVKTFTPDIPADFTGASTQLQSRDIPDDFVLDLGASVEYNSVTTGKNFIRDIRYPADAFAFGNLKRGLPTGLPKDAPLSALELDDDGNRVYTDDELETYGESLLMHTDPIRLLAPPNYALKATVGDGYNLGRQRRIGWVVSARSGDGYETIRAKRQWLNAQGGELLPNSPRFRYSTLESSRKTKWSLAALGKFQKGLDHTVYLNTFYSRDAENEVRDFEGTSSATVGGNDEIVTTRHRYIMRSVGFAQLGGDHRIEKAKGLEINWFGAFSQARRDDPQIREILYRASTSDPDRSNPADYRTAADVQDPLNLTLQLVDNVENGSLDFKMPFKQWKQLESYVKVGGWAEGKQRQFDVRRFQFADSGGMAAAPLGIGNPVNPFTIGPAPAPFFLREAVNPNDNYRATQQLFAGYGMLELPFVRWFKLVGGARFEYSKIEVESFNPYDPDDTMVSPPTELVDRDVFPSVSFIFSTRNDMNVRLAGTRTIARPEFRELAEFSFTDFVGGMQVQGNPELISTHVWNADLRWEWFPSATEVVAVSGFFKWFDEPIERALGQGPSSLPATFINADLAYNVGGEVELKKNLQFFAKRSKNKGGGYYPASKILEDFSVGLNAAYIYSIVELPQERDCTNAADPVRCSELNQFTSATSSSRPLQGQSPWIVNGYLSYDDDDIGLNTRLLYNVYGPRVAAIGGQTQPDTYELPVHTLDLVASQRIFRFGTSEDAFLAEHSHELRATFGVGNILNWPIRFQQDDGQNKINTFRYRRGIDVQVGLEYAF